MTWRGLTFVHIANKKQEDYDARGQGNKEYKWISNILCKNSWNVYSLSQELSITEEETKKLLKGFGYDWDSQKMLYVATEKTVILRKLEPKKYS